MTLPSDQSKSIKATFWTTCPRKLQYFPDSPCYLGQASVNTRREECAWYINSLEDNYCFWKWVRRVSDKDGFMDPLLQSEISEMLGLSNSKINQHFKDAVEKIKGFAEFEELREFF